MFFKNELAFYVWKAEILPRLNCNPTGKAFSSMLIPS